MSSDALRTPIAVVGMACRLPGAEDLDGFWTLLSEGRSAVVEMPPDRLDRDLYVDSRKGERGRTYSTIGGLVGERDPVSGDDSYDICHRLFADVAVEACRHAGLDRDELAAQSVGVFVGHSGGSPEFGDITLGTMAAQAYEPLRSAPAVSELDRVCLDSLVERAAARLRDGKATRGAGGEPHSESRWAAELAARTLGLTGPNLVLDAACSSSLVALSLGALALERGDVDVALVGGASYAQTSSLILFSQAQSCSAHGSRPFDAEADGLVGSEGYVALVLKTEEKARRDGDEILAVIPGIGLSTDGRGRHLWAPRREGQTAAMQRAYGSTVDPAGIQYIEAHATSTQVGDATEIESMAGFFGDHLSDRKVPIGSVKSNIGHTLETAGLASLLKTILAMRHGTIPPTINIERLNETIDWDAVPFEVARSARPWTPPDGERRRAAVSAFGIGGLNVHLIVEEPADTASTNPGANAPSPLSAEPIAIVGRGLVVPGAHDMSSFEALLERGVPVLSEAPESRWPGGVGVEKGEGPWTSPTSRGGFVRDYVYDSVLHRVPPKQIAAANPLQFMLLDATEQALAEAGEVDRARTGVVVGTGFGGEFGNQLLLGIRFPEIRRCLDEVLRDEGFDESRRGAILDGYEERFFQVYPALDDVTGSFTSSTLASRITKAFDLEGGAMAIDSGEASSLVALSTASALLRGGVVSAVVCAGAQRSLDLPAFETMARKGHLDRPDDRPGEGVGVVLLKRLSDARRDGNQVLGLVLGDACRYGDTEVESATAEAARQALASSGLEADQIDGVELRGGGAAGREAQAAALGRVYAAAGTAREPALASLIGHLGPAEGVVSLLRASVQPREGLEALHTVSESGLSAHLIVGPSPPVRVPGAAGSRVSLGAPTEARLRQKLLYTDGVAHAPFDGEDRFRLAVVASDPADMADRLTLAESMFGSADQRPLLEEHGIFFGELRAERRRVAFVFSGQGSQYEGMLQDLVEHSPAARRAMDDADRHLEAAGLGSFAELAWSDGGRLDEDPVTTQIAILVADTILYAAVVESGIEPDCVCGHSFGEISAMVAARVVTLEQAIRITVERARALATASPEGGLLSVQATPERVRELIDVTGRDLHVTHHNAPTQTVVGGRRADLTVFAEQLAAEGVKTRPLKVPGALHSPLVASAQEPLRAALEKETLRPPTRLLYSNVSCAQVARPEDAVENLVRQLVEPLDYPALMRRLVADGVGALVEVGPGQVLTRLHRQLVSPDIVCAGTDHRRRSAWEQLERVRASLECVGALEGRSSVPTGMQPAPGTITEFDATATRRRKRRAEATATQPERAAPDPAPTDTDAAVDGTVANMMVDFVVDLTGYPREVIRLDWDLEADLGLDSIKRTQLVGEVAEALAVEISADDGPVLAQLTTLRDLIGFFQDPGSNGQAPASVAPGPGRPEFQAYESGFEEGRRHASRIRASLRDEALSLTAGPPVRSVADTKAELSASDRSRLQGMADGSGVHVGNLIAYRLRRGADPTPTPGDVAATREPNRDDAGPVSRRYVMEMIDLPHPDDVEGRALTGSALVVGEGSLARRLQERLESEGMAVHRLAPTGAAAEAVAVLDEVWDEAPVPHLFFAMGRDDEAVRELGEERWSGRRGRALMTPFWVCQRWLSLVKGADLMDEASLVGLTGLGGDFGFSGAPGSFETGALTGLFKAISIESWVAGHRHLPVKIIDAPRSEDADAVIDAALRELAIPSYEAEVGVRDATRRVVRPQRRDLPAADGPVDLGEVWICTGGARGITAHVARELGGRFGLRLHLIGRARREELSEAWLEMWPDRRRELKVMVMDAARTAGDNPVKAWESAQKSLEIEETLAALGEMDVEATYHSCDISDRSALEQMLEAVRSEGPIDGILHGAGSSRDAKFEQKEPDRVDQCFRAKVDGTLALMELTRNDPLRYFVAFGSVSGRFGANGHADYSAANDMMAKLVDWYRGQRPDVAALTFHWHAWGDVGMATRAETQLGLQLVDMDFMPAAEGVEHIIRELHAGAPEAEVLITQESYYARFYSEEADAADPDAATLRPLLGDESPAERDGRRVFSCTLDPERDVFLTDHRLDGRPLLPLVAALELAAEAAVEDPDAAFEVQDLEICNGLSFRDASRQTVRVEASPAAEGSTTCEVVADFRARDGTLLEADRPIVRGTFGALAPETVPQGRLDQDVPDGAWRTIDYDDQASRFHHGPAFRSLRRFSVTEDGLWGEVIAPAIVELGGTRRPSTGWRVHLAALDACLYATACLAWTLEPGQSIPAGLDHLVVGRFPRPREDCRVHVVAGEQTDDGGRFDFRLFGADGEALLEARGYRVARIAANDGVTS